MTTSTKHTQSSNIFIDENEVVSVDLQRLSNTPSYSDQLSYSQMRSLIRISNEINFNHFRILSLKLDPIFKTYAESFTVGTWAANTVRIPVIDVCGMISHINISHFPKVLDLWKYSKMVNPTQDTRTNQTLNKICWSIGFHFAENTSSPYHKLYLEALDKYGITDDNVKKNESSARRWTIRLFMAHWHAIDRADYDQDLAPKEVSYLDVDGSSKTFKIPL